MEQKIYYANIYVIFFFNCKLVLLQTCVIDNARFKLNGHNKIPLSLHAGLILTKYVYISHILACTCHDPLSLAFFPTHRHHVTRVRPHPSPGENPLHGRLRDLKCVPQVGFRIVLIYCSLKKNIVYLCCAMKMIFF